MSQETHGSFGAFKFNLRFPGQWFDQETGLYHNGMRDYHPGLGRYLQSDPLGLEAGWSTYGYAGANSLSYSDPYGLDIIQDAFDYWQPPALDQGFANLSASVGDELSWGGTAYVRSLIGNDIVNQCAPSYKAGAWATILATLPKSVVGAGLKRIGNYTLGSYKNVRNMHVGTGKYAHHIFQHAAMSEMPGYSHTSAPAISLIGPSTLIGTPHYKATQAQRILRYGGGTYSSERRVSYRSLRAAGLNTSQAKSAVREADQYFFSLGVNMNTSTRIPGNRR